MLMLHSEKSSGQCYMKNHASSVFGCFLLFHMIPVTITWANVSFTLQEGKCYMKNMSEKKMSDCQLWVGNMATATVYKLREKIRIYRFSRNEVSLNTFLCKTATVLVSFCVGIYGKQRIGVGVGVFGCIHLCFDYDFLISIANDTFMVWPINKIIERNIYDFIRFFNFRKYTIGKKNPLEPTLQSCNFYMTFR